MEYYHPVVTKADQVDEEHKGKKRSPAPVVPTLNDLS
jgi:hypothetical protein